MHLGYVHEPAEENPELALRHYGRAIEFLRAGDKARASEELRQVLRHDPDFSEARARLKELARNCKKGNVFPPSEPTSKPTG
jgi:Tfp pilus assembly protein PilF